MRTKATLRYEYERRLRSYYLELKRRQRHDLPLGFSDSDLDQFVEELRALTGPNEERRMPKAA